MIDQDKQIELSPLDTHYRKIPITDGPYDLSHYELPFRTLSSSSNSFSA